MTHDTTISVNGVRYDARTGMPLDEITPSVKAKASHAKVVHARAQRSHTLHRAVVKKVHDTPAKVTSHSVSTKIAVTTKPKVQRSPHITRFARDITPSKPTSVAQTATPDIGPSIHPHVQKAHAMAKPKVVAPVHHPSARQTKDHAISTALAHASSESSSALEQPKRRLGKTFNIATASIAIVLLAGYFTYLNMPNLSVRVAAVQAGIDASYPSYRPTGYRLSGPVAYSDGQVTMQFEANAGPQSFALNQAKSSWDSSALLTNFIEPQSKGNYLTYSDAGLTVYTYGSNAAWVNGGILYTISGDAPLSGDQVRNIATSM